MKLPGYAIRIILVILFFAAVGARFASTKNSTYPYFKAGAAMTYRGVTAVAEGRDLDQLTTKSNWPEGFRPARAHVYGVQYLTGYSFRVAKYLSEIDARKFCRRFLVLFFCLNVFIFYSITFKLWGSQGAGLFAAFLVAFFPPLIAVTNGKTFDQAPFAVVFAALQLLSIIRYAKDPTWKKAVVTGVTGYLLLLMWDLAAYYVAILVAAVTLFAPLRYENKRMFAIFHLAAFLIAASFVPYLLSLRSAFSWHAALLAACCLYTFFHARFPSRLRGTVFILVVSAVLCLAVTPLRAGAEQALPGLKYVFYRIRFLFDKPVDPGMLPPAVRLLWSGDHANPSGHTTLNFFSPMLFFIPAIVAAAKLLWSTTGPGALERWHVFSGLILAASVGVAYLVDRSVVAFASAAVIPVLAMGLIGVGRQKKTNGPLLAVGAFLILVQLVAPLSKSNAVLRIAESAGIAHKDKSNFLWVSLENTDQELIRFVATRTSVSDAFLGNPGVTAVLLAFSGRTSVLLTGTFSEANAKKHTDLTGLFYGPEKNMYEKCRELGIKYVLYSIDVVLNTSRYGPAYLAGVADLPEDCVALAMQFSPETLTNFNLVYENHHYRLYKVTDEFEPMFTTDHLPVYQREIFTRHGDTFDSFHDRIIQLLVAYSAAEAAIANGDNDTAVTRLKWCLDRAPRYTRARVALGSTLLQMGQLEEARDHLFTVIQYAPDNPLALYYGAYAAALLEDAGTAKGLLDILYGLSNDNDLLSRARLLEAMIERGVPAPSDTTGSPNK